MNTISPSSPIDNLFTAAQVAQKYHLHNSTIRTYIKKGLLPAQKTLGGKNWLIRERDAVARLSAPPPDRGSLCAGAIRPWLYSQHPQPSLALIDRLGTPEGRARLIAFLGELREEDGGEQEAVWEVLKNGVTPLSLRQWTPAESEASEQAA